MVVVKIIYCLIVVNLRYYVYVFVGLKFLVRKKNWMDNFGVINVYMLNSCSLWCIKIFKYIIFIYILWK